MAQKLSASIAQRLTLNQGFVVQFTAVDAATGDVVPDVQVSGASMIVAQLSAGAPADLASGQFVPLLTPIELEQQTGDVGSAE